ncbi:type I glyceraldehyde-3-phosphate dehydrogenase [bacterium]|nr:type I glyceraldehyde-3-phosphate dehydrogenase [bacterium]
MFDRVKVGINGFGRIGRLVTKLAAERGWHDMDIVGINDIMPTATMAHLLKYDSVHGRFKGDIQVDGDLLIVNGHKIKITKEKDPANLPWAELKANVVMECTGLFRDKESAGKHIAAGAKKVIISAPAKSPDGTFVLGVNHKTYDPQKHNIISNASCTTNCLAPVIKVLHENFKVEYGFMTTIHSYTNDQRILDCPHSDLRRARAGAINQIPTTTGAAAAIGLVIPELKGKLDGISIRVPTANVSCVDLVVTCSKPITKESVNEALQNASENELKDILGYCDEPCVSTDFIGDPRSSIVDADVTNVIGNMVKTLSWYDNEAGFSCRMIELAKMIGK